jgi:hypothetical protein
MLVPLNKLMEKLGVDRVLSPYETQPWFHHDPEKNISCSAEVRMGPAGEDIEAEIQFLGDENDESGANAQPQQIMRLRALPVSGGLWSPMELRVKGEDYANRIFNWEEKGCNFFHAFIAALQMGQIPDVDDLIDKELDDDNFGGGKKGRVGRKSPKIKPGQLLGMGKRGM